MFEIRVDDLSGASTRSLIALHLAGMHSASPPGTVFALDLSGLQGPEISVWTVWHDNAIAGIGALKILADGTAEVKSMRTHPDHLRKGVAALLLDHIIGEAKKRDVVRLSLETGTGPAFEPALALYRGRGFIEGDVFSDYAISAFSCFFHLSI